MADINWAEAKIAEEFLSDAFDALIGTSSRERLGLQSGTPKREEERQKDYLLRQAAITHGAWLKRLHLARTSVLFTALACEAATNYYLAVNVDSRDAKGLERLETPEKLLLAPRLIGEPLFVRDREPMGQVVGLFKLRNRLVHPKVGSLRVTNRGLTGAEGYKDFNPETAAECLLAVAQVMVTLAKAYDRTANPPYLADQILAHGTLLRESSRRATAELPKPPGALVRALQQYREASGEQP